MWLVSLEQQYGSLWKEFPFLFSEASTLVLSSPTGTLCSVEPISFGLAILWEMTLASFSSPPPHLGRVTSYHHRG